MAFASKLWLVNDLVGHILSAPDETSTRRVYASTVAASQQAKAASHEELIVLMDIALLLQSFWKRHFHGRPPIVGKDAQSLWFDSDEFRYTKKLIQ